MGVKESVLRRNDLLAKIGKYSLSTQFPEDFEVYVVALELVNSDGETLKYFIFPVMPNTLDESINFNTNIKKTLGGVSVLKTTTFIPTDITLAGSFGRRLQVLLGKEYVPIISGFKKVVDSKGQRVEFDTKVKTGYGCCKILQSICNDSKELDGGKPRTLIFYNLALGNSYVVEPMNLRFNMSMETNMIWNYSLPLKSVAPISFSYSSKEFLKERARLGRTDLVQQELSRLTSKINRFL